MKDKLKLTKTKLTFLILLLVIIALGTTYAILTWASSNTSIAGNTKCFKVDYTKGQDINFGSITSGTGLVAQTSFNKDEAVSTTLTISRNADCDICGTGTISANITASIDLSKGGLSYKVYLGSSKVKSGSITKTGVSILYDNFDIKYTTTNTYTIYFYLDANKIDNNYLKTNFTGKIYAEAKSTKEICNSSSSGNLYNTIASKAVSDSVTSTTTSNEGIYMKSGTESNTYPIYYYKGNVSNNNVLFANFCWKIVRTTETGGIKIIYNGVPSNGSCNNTGTATQIGTSAFNTNENSLAYVGYMYGTVYEQKELDMSNITNTYYYSNDVEYSNGTYYMSNDQISSDSFSDISTAGTNEIANHRYTCFSEEDNCNTIYYITSEVGNNDITYIELNDGKKVEDALSDMLDYNTTDSTIKLYIDDWYKKNMTSYTEKLEDTVWCNSRKIEDIGGWSPNGLPEQTEYTLTFSSSLSCEKDSDKFTVSTNNGNGKLTYPIGLLSSDEMVLAGGSLNSLGSNYYLNCGTPYWLLSPANQRVVSFVRAVSNDEAHLLSAVSSTDIGVRPAVSLYSEIKIISGNGTVDSPYIVE